MSTPVRLGRFVLARFPPHLYVTYGLLWTVALEGTAALVSDRRGGWSPSPWLLARAVTVVLIFLFLRILDEHKDLDYDRVHNPDRPLVTGEITAAELRVAMVGIGVLVVAINTGMSATSATLAMFAIGYGFILVVLEKWSTRVRDGLLLNLAISYPVQILIGLYVYGSATSTGQPDAGWRVVPLLAIFACAFLHFEFARKTSRQGGNGQRLYSNVFGVAGSASIALVLGCAAVLLDVLLIQPWQYAGVALAVAVLPCAAAVFALVGAGQLLLRGRSCWPVAPAMGLIVALYTSLIVQAAVLD
jgi:hypothetical protein